MNKTIRTIGDLKALFKDYEDEEPLTMYLWSKTPLFGEQQEVINCTGIQSTAGGRAAILWFETEKPNGNS